MLLKLPIMLLSSAPKSSLLWSELCLVIKLGLKVGRILAVFQMYLHYASISSNLTLFIYHNIHTKLP